MEPFYENNDVIIHEMTEAVLTHALKTVELIGTVVLRDELFLKTGEEIIKSYGGAGEIKPACIYLTSPIFEHSHPILIESIERLLYWIGLQDIDAQLAYVRRILGTFKQAGLTSVRNYEKI